MILEKQLRKSFKNGTEEGLLMDAFMGNTYHVPQVCLKCNGKMLYKGCGEYACETCGTIEFDDYGKVRLYIEQHPGVNAQDVEVATGVPGRTIRQLLREERLEIAPDSKVFLRCEGCGKNIRSGRFCIECADKYRHLEQEKTKQRNQKAIAGFGMERPKGEEGERRFIHWDK
jgi:hypothetical protein